jgi:hypothetical protein
MKAYGLFDFMMKKVWSLPPASPQAGLIRSANWVGLTDSRSDEYFPASSLPPVLAGIRASKSLHFAFPCKLHSGLLKWSARINSYTCLPLRGQHTLVKMHQAHPDFVFPV